MDNYVVCKIFKITLRVVGVKIWNLAESPVFIADVFQGFFKLEQSKENVITIIWVKVEEICLWGTSLMVLQGL